MGEGGGYGHVAFAAEESAGGGVEEEDALEDVEGEGY